MIHRNKIGSCTMRLRERHQHDVPVGRFRKNIKEGWHSLRTVLIFCICWGVVLLMGHSTSRGQSDGNATIETRNLYANMKRMSGRGIMVGHQNTQTMFRDGRNFENVPPYPSDCVRAVGEYPAVHGFDFNPVNREHNLIRDEIIDAHLRGGIITISWHAHNPLSGGGHKDRAGNPMREITPGGSANKAWRSELDKKVKFFKGLTVDGVKIPVLFRPFHEHTHNAFWWGVKSCSSEEYVSAYRYTVDYLRDKGVDNLLLVYSPYSVTRTGEEEMRSRYPGDKYVDFVAVDHYGNEIYRDGEEPWEVFYHEFLENCEITASFAQKHEKPVVIAEIGVRKGLKNSSKTSWYVDLLEMLKSDAHARQFVYMLLWQNGPENYWVPLPGDPHHADFKSFHQDPYTLFETDLPDMYRAPSTKTGR
ncbi:glycoside hydrolase family 26 protein [Crateriforma spongiae]|uniref:glycoside hydrolase family 26 protein n=1 Tax=Crateriforma spongiae TaxID=2724528 RepID=UPI0028F432AA|nr:glycosyl hydrolase [Crateriforma spongiae]